MSNEPPEKAQPPATEPKPRAALPPAPPSAPSTPPATETTRERNEEDNVQRPDGSGVPSQARRLGWRIVVLIAGLVVVILIWHALKSHSPAPVATTAESVPHVAVAKVMRSDLYNDVTYDAEFRPYMEVELHAKVSGYVKEMNVDFGDRVKAGQVLATLEVPELHDELHNAVALEQKAEADYKAAHLNFTRLAAVSKQNPSLVAQQDLDTAEAKDGMALAEIAAAKADVGKYQTLTNYTAITAPFDGVITRRYVDPGALVQESRGSETSTLPLLRVSDNYLLRLDFPVEVQYVKDVHVGATVQVRVESLGDKTFTGKITRATERITETTRTMITEIEVPNPDLELVPGMYATASLRVRAAAQALSVPIEAVAGEKGSARGSVLVVNSNQELEERSVKLGVETPNRYQISSGLEEGDLVVVGSRAEFKPGQKVQPKLVDSLSYE
jgi:RND family efflux transporter MFP subunit